jgi:hypothetical protein
MFGAVKLLVAGVSVALVSAFFVSGAIGPSGPAVPGAMSPASPGASGVDWTTERVSLSADDFRLDVNDLEFGVDVEPQLHSDPGDSNYWTLEVTWFEHEVEQRLNMYFGSDGTDWWVDEIRTYDGYDPGEWVYAYGPLFQTPLGEAFEGDVQVDLLGIGRPDDRENLVPAVLSFTGMRLAVSPGTEDLGLGLGETSPAASPTAAEKRQAKKDAAVERALFAAFRQPADGPAICRTVEEAQALAEEVLAEQGAKGWTVELGSNLHEDGCGTIGLGEDRDVIILTGMHPDVRTVIDEFSAYSLKECLDETTAVDTLTARLNEIGRTDFTVRVSSMLGGPSHQMEEIQAHADAGCVFYVGVGAEADGTPIYELHGD